MSRINALQAKGKYEQALELGRLLADEHPANAEVQHVLGMIHIKMGNHAIGLEHHSLAASRGDQNPKYLAFFAEALNLNGYVDEAIEIYRKCLELDPDYYYGLTGLGALLCQLERHTAAATHLRKAVKIKKNDPHGLLWAATALANIDQYDEALRYAERARKLDPKSPYALTVIGRIHMFSGDKEAAEKNYLAALQLQPKLGQAYTLLATSKKFTPDDAALISRMEKLLCESLPAEARDHIHFALGKAYNDLKDWDRAFHHYKRGNDLIASNYDENAVRATIKSIRKVFTGDFLASHGDMGHPSERPVFIVGMPRAGTTLTDQILSAHSQVSSVGESPLIDYLVQQHFSSPGTGKPISPELITRDSLMAAAQQYLDEIEVVETQDTRRIVNKMPFNFFHLGIISLMFPNAKIIYLKRNPLDNCLSCYFQRFSSPMLGWTTDMSQLGAYYKHHLALMEHWKRELRIPILEMEYEALVADFDAQARRLIEFCGLAWEPSCAEFYRSKREVRTASVMQVRQPVYRSSVERWRNYEAHITPLKDALGLQQPPLHRRLLGLLGLPGRPS